MKRILTIGAAVLAGIGTAAAGPNDSNWVQLLRAGDTSLSDWIVKIQGFNAGENPNNIVHYATGPDGHSPRLEIIDTVTWSPNFGYGHIFYKKPFSDYLLRAQFHFPSKKSYAIANGSWTVQNNGLMLHCQSPASMDKGQAYPNSIEDQLLGYWSGAGGGAPHTRSSNLCVPGTTVNYQGKWYSDATGHHCTDAKFHSLLYDSSVATAPGANSSNAQWPGADIWQYAMARVLDSSSMTFWVRSRPDTAWDSVFSFTSIHVGQAASETNLGSAKPLTGGYIALQMEGTTTEFAKIELLNLVGCMDKKDTAYRAYFVKDSAAACSGVTAVNGRGQARFGLERAGASIKITGEGATLAEVRRADGTLVARFPQGARAFEPAKPGLYFLTARTADGSATRAFAFF